MLTWELIGAVVGAGLASGREIASFFSQYGNWSYVGIILAVLTMCSLCDTAIPPQWKGRWIEWLWQALLSMLLIATGGAMLSGAGAIAALTLPLPYAHWLGMAGTIALSWFLAYRTTQGLAWVSRILMAALAMLILLGLGLPRMQAAQLNEVSVPQALLRGVCYGGFNVALQVPIMAGAMICTEKEGRRASFAASGIILALLLLGNAVLLRHPALLSEEMPFIRIAAEFGSWGYVLGSICLYLAVLSTLTACLRGLGRKTLPLSAIVFVSLLGFTGVVERVYPILGGGCFLMLLAAKFTNSSRKPFHS